ncbi:MAG: septum formation initiator family protein [Verrucomicrobiae bacterium]|nr:septum formation initiator family protein [Verrucomicrobiae bacterium]MDW8307923.1 septum formation initiator family protein [Verrucomicrobiales bacterium]
MNVQPGIWHKLTRLAMGLILLALLLLIGVWYLPLIRTNERYRQELLRLDAQIQREEETARQLKNSIEALRTDPRAVERLARERLGYARPGETVIRFEASPTNAPSGH